MGGRFENFTPPTLGSELTTSEILLLEGLNSLANSSSLEFLQKIAGSVVNTSLSELLVLINLSDVLISDPTNGQILTYNGSAWVNGAASSGGTWGDITGTLSAQTDLQTELDAKQDVLTGLTASVTELNFVDGVTSAIQTQIAGLVPYTGATG